MVVHVSGLPRRTFVSHSLGSQTMLSFFKLSRRRSHQYTASSSPATSATGVELADCPSTSSPIPPSNLTTDSYARSVPLPSGKVLQLRTCVCYLPHPEKQVHYGGEDAHFMSDYGGGVIGVADGVGGWQESGVNPADYSRTLMQLARAYLEGKDMFQDLASTRQGVLVDPRGALEAAHMNTKVPGSATACVMQLDQANGVLAAANLGDSGFVVIRDGRELVRSKPLQHYFDCPLQFGAFPEFVEATDTADMADIYSIALRPGDVIIAGTDGLWDNCYVTEIISLLPKGPSDVQASADAIATAARRHASDVEYASPYTREALSQGLDLPWWDKLLGMSFKGGKVHLKQLTGGKMDDITVLVSFVDMVDAPSSGPAANAFETSVGDGSTSALGTKEADGEAHQQLLQ
uniref:Protein phosphatase n=1 Tax=Eudorina sp. 2006-703-Eu-15 TaxID=593785 RepID=A0A2Z5X8I1_9CHLO|nr:protein phospatase 2C [Eudorina sp. 2006-703-Eu-15]